MAIIELDGHNSTKCSAWSGCKADLILWQEGLVTAALKENEIQLNRVNK